MSKANKGDTANRSSGSYPVKKMILKANIRSSIVWHVLDGFGVSTLDKFHRIGGLKQMIGKDSQLLKMVNGWQHTNMEIANSQIQELELRNEAVLMDDSVEIPEISVPDEWRVRYESRFPIAHEYMNLIKKLDTALEGLESLYYSGVVDEPALDKGKHLAVAVIAGVAQRISKATTPGKRVNNDNGNSRYTPKQMMAYIRDGFRLDFSDVGNEYRELVNDYQEATSAFKTKIVGVDSSENTEAA